MTKKLHVDGDAPRGRRVARLVMTTLILLVVVYVALFLAVRTEGFRSYAQEYLENTFGLPVHIGKAWAAITLDLILEDVASTGKKRVGEEGFSVDQAVVQWSLLDPVLRGGYIVRGIELKGAHLSFVRGSEGGWEPKALARLGAGLAKWVGVAVDMPEDEPGPEGEGGQGEKRIRPKKPNPRFWLKINLDVSDGRVAWWDSQGEELASAEGIGLKITPVSLPNRRLTHFVMTVERARMGDGRRVHNLDFEMLQTGSQNIVLACNGEWGPEAEAIRARDETEKGGTGRVADVVSGDLGSVAEYLRRAIGKPRGE